MSSSESPQAGVEHVIEDASVLVVEDDPAMADLVVDGLSERGFRAASVSEGNAALARLDTEHFDVVVSDLHMPEMNGLELCDRLSRREPQVPVVLMTAFGSIDRAITAMRVGAHDFLIKPFEMDELVIRVERALQHARLQSEVRTLRDQRPPQFCELLGESPAMKRVFRLIERLAPTEASVLLTGETGTGKKLAARALHRGSQRSEGPFISANCAAMPEALLESELFGQVHGALTGVQPQGKGLFHEARGGTLFLDEIDAMPNALQAKLLCVLQERRLRPLGAEEEISVDVRVIGATRQDLETLVDAGRFREDLFYRLNVAQIALPPLRARGSDIVKLAYQFVVAAAGSTGKSVSGIQPRCAERLLEYPWPGNVRELQNAMERATALCSTSEIRLKDLPEKVQDHKRSHFLVTAEDPTQLVPMYEVERRYVLRVLEATGGNKTRAAQILGFDRKTLYTKLKQYGVDEKA